MSCSSFQRMCARLAANELLSCPSSQWMCARLAANELGTVSGAGASAMR